MDTSHKTDFWFFGLRYVGLIGDFEGPNVTILRALSQTFKKSETKGQK